MNNLPINREQAWELVKKYNSQEKNLFHYLESESVMRALAKKLNQDVERWGMLGLLHDIDWELTADNPQTHLIKAPELLKQAGFADDFITTIVSHGYGCDCAGLINKQRSTVEEHALAAAETITGLIYSAALMRPDKINSLEPSSLNKKFKDKSFAAKVNREVIKECELIGIPLNEFFILSINAVKGIANIIGLA